MVGSSVAPLEQLGLPIEAVLEVVGGAKRRNVDLDGVVAMVVGRVRPLQCRVGGVVRSVDANADSLGAIVCGTELEGSTTAARDSRLDLCSERTIEDIASSCDDLRTVDDAMCWLSWRDLKRKRVVVKEGVVVTNGAAIGGDEAGLPLVGQIAYKRPILLTIACFTSCGTAIDARRYCWICDDIIEAGLVEICDGSIRPERFCEWVPVATLACGLDEW